MQRQCIKLNEHAIGKYIIATLSENIYKHPKAYVYTYILQLNDKIKMKTIKEKYLR